MGDLSIGPIDMDELHEGNLEATRAAGREPEEDTGDDDRGDDVASTESDDTAGATTDDKEAAGGKEDDDDGSQEDDLDPDILAEIAGDGQPGGVPVGRVGEIAREKTAALQIAQGLAAGEVNLDVLQEVGGVQAAAKAVARGEMMLEQLADFSAHEDDGQHGDGSTGDGADNELADMKDKYADLQAKFYDAKYEEDEDAAAEYAKQMADLTIEIAKRELLPSVQNTLEEQVTNKILSSITATQEEAEYADADQTAIAIYERHPELEDESSLELARFRSLVAVERENGVPLKDAFETAEKILYGGTGASGNDKGSSGGDDESSMSQRELLARLRNAKAASRQPANLASAGGVSGRDKDKKLSVADLTEEEFDALSPREKARLRGDIV